MGEFSEITILLRLGLMILFFVDLTSEMLRTMVVRKFIILMDIGNNILVGNV